MPKKTTKPIEATEEKSFEITKATIKDSFCDFSFINLKDDVTNIAGIGTKLKANGKGIIKDTMYEVFRKFNLHLAVIDDIFKHAGIEIKHIEKMHNHEFCGLYDVTEFETKGEAGINESIMLKGTKHLNCGGRMEVKTPWVPLDNASSYAWHTELLAILNECRHEVELYGWHHNYTEVEPKEEKVEGQLFNTENGAEDNDLEKHKV